MKKILMLLSGGLLLSAVVSASPLPPNANVDNPDIPPNASPDFTVGLPANFGSYVSVATLASPYVGAFTGTVTTNVWRDTDNTLTFGYEFTNTSPLPVKDMVSATIGDPTQPWLGYVISDAGSDESGQSTGGLDPVDWTDGDPSSIGRDPTISGEGLQIRWRDAGAGTVIRNSADYSALVWFDTDAVDYQLTDIGILDSGLTADAQGYAPLAVSTIPEPASLALFGLLGLTLMRRRR